MVDYSFRHLTQQQKVHYVRVDVEFPFVVIIKKDFTIFVTAQISIIYQATWLSGKFTQTNIS